MSNTLRWFKSSYSNANGGDCIEVAFGRHALSYETAGGNRAEATDHPRAVHIRDSKVPAGPTFAVAPAAWSTFLTWAH